jgi:hypothetical protein
MNVTRLVFSLLLPPLCFAMWSCDSGGKALAGGGGDDSLYDQSPPAPSPPVVLGTWSVQCVGVATTAIGEPPERQDRFRALKDTLTLVISAGASGNTVAVRVADLDPRVDDTFLLQDRGNELWLGRGRAIDGAPFAIELITDDQGVPLQYIVVAQTTSVQGKYPTTTKQTFARVPNAIIDAPGLKVAQVSSVGPPTKHPPEPGDRFDLIVDASGLAQWEQDTFEQRYRWNPLLGMNEAQTTTYGTNPPLAPNLENHELLDAAVSEAQRTATEHSGGEVEQAVSFIPPAGWVKPLDDHGVWHAKVSNPDGVFRSYPYILTHHQSDVAVTIDDPHLLVRVTANGMWDAATHTMSGGTTDVFHIIRLEAEHLIAVRVIADNTYDQLTLYRDAPAGSLLLTPHTQSGDDKNLVVQRVSNGKPLAAYALGDAEFPLEWWP